MQAELGAIIEGKVTGITKFGAFVTMPDGTSGLVHISEIANTYVNDINEYLTVGQQVKVKVVGITPEGKINLSIKKAVSYTQILSLWMASQGHGFIMCLQWNGFLSD